VSISVKIIGIDRANEQLANIGQVAVEAARQGINMFVEGVGAEAVEECPWKTRALARSWFSEETVENDIISILCGFNINYAVYVHEDLEAFHPNGGKAKFLEDPFQRHIPQLPGYLGDIIADAIAGAGVA
jgi:hypothetical protein